jgi:toxin secretion/phage lysis holin
MDNIKLYIVAALGAIGGALSWAFGGWDKSIIALVTLMGIDFALGLILAVLGKSNKTKSGALSSEAGLRGIAKKVGMLLLIIFGVTIDRYAGIDFCRDAVCVALIANEAISLLENFGLLGLPIPQKLKSAIEILQTKGEKDNG